jgi:hypothetical protein
MVQLLTDPGAAHFEEDDPWDIAEREFEDDDFDTYQTVGTQACSSARCRQWVHG